MLFLSLFGSSMLLTLVFGVFLTPLLRKYLSKKNFRRHIIPTGSGLFIILTYFVALLGLVFFFEDRIAEMRDWLLALTILVTAMGLLGFADDMFGARDVGGFKGHFTELFRGNVTTGAIKAIGGGFTCLFVSWLISPGVVALCVNALLMALFSNIFNLLDLRPGRALKLFLILGLAVFVFSFKSPFWMLSGIFAGSASALLYADLSESCMLGDVGSNVLGAIVGFVIAVNFGLAAKLLVLALAVAFQVYAEGHSITSVIENNPALRKLDEFGRRRSFRETRKKEKIFV